MSKIKLLATLFVGIFIGYILASITAIDQHEDSNIILVEKKLIPKTPANLGQKTPENIDVMDAQPTEIITEESQQTSPETMFNKNIIYQELEKKYQQLSKVQQASENKIASLKQILTEMDESEISTTQMEDLVEAPFKDLVANFTGANKDEIYNFHQTEEDLDWGYNMQNYLSDFILTHYNADEINLVSVLCKQQKCELLIIQHTNGGWDKITQDLRQQPWWKFSSTNSSSGNYPNSENSIAIYTFLLV
ncbi:MAG: hypothetical protein ACI89T_000174 [Cognaticolwellia sp.]|jgi:hypothetical protein